MIFCFCGGLELFGIVVLFGWIMRKINKIRKKHDTGECCDLEHVGDEPRLIGYCSCCGLEFYEGDLSKIDEDRIVTGSSVECADCNGEE